jgi:PII-like signaling protein
MGLRDTEYRSVSSALSLGRLDRSSDRTANGSDDQIALINRHAQNRFLPMELPEDALLLRIFIGESDRYHHRPLYEAIVLKAREMHLAGATVLRGPMGFGASSRIHTAKIIQLSMDLPIVIEIVDTEEKLNGFLPVLDEMMSGGLITLEKARVIRYRAAKDRHV